MSQIKPTGTYKIRKAGNYLEKTKKSKKKIIVCMAALTLCLCVVAVYFIYELQFRKEALSYVQEVNADGIAVDLSDNPYFMKKIIGFRYNKAERIQYESEVTNSTKHAYVLLPPNYDESKKYPVLYLLHGWGGSDKTWLNKDADIIIQNSFYLDDVQEMIVVFPNSCVNKEESVPKEDFIADSKIYDLTEKDLMTSLMPYVNEHYSTYTDRNHTAIAGYSLGGKESLYTAFTHQDVFGYVGSFSTVSPIPDENGVEYAATMTDFVIDENIGGFHYMLINTGVDDPYIAGVHTVENALKRNQIPHVYYEMEGRHENKVWQNALYNYLKHIF